MSVSIAAREISLPPGALLDALLSLDARRRLSVLDSCDLHHQQPDAARYLIAGFDPVETVEVRGAAALLEDHRAGETKVVSGIDPFTLLAERLAKYRVPSEAATPLSSPVLGACVATLSYDLARRFERWPANQKAPIDAPEADAVFAFYDALVVHDYRTARTEIVSVAGESKLDQVEETLRRTDPFGPLFPSACGGARTSFATDLTRDEYLAAVRDVKEHIFAGDIYQANLTQEFCCPLGETRPEDVFRHLRRDHPAPFAAFLRRREDTVISASPERFLRVTPGSSGRVIEAWPIKGTRRRGRDAAEDAALRAELLASEKDRAENVMIVDLLRNDLGRVCCYGSIEVAQLCALEAHPTLFHLVSRVRGVLRNEAGVREILRAAFPCGSITGAPKIRAMEIIDETEKTPRGLSMGAIGYFDFRGRFDLNVAIRTMVVRDQTARFKTGGGITAESDPAAEYDESMLKARALLRALQNRQDEHD